MTLKVLDAGMFTLVQDMGWKGWRAQGMPRAGAMDLFSLRVANRLVGNPPHCAGLEMTFRGATLENSLDTVFALAGADMMARLDGKPVSPWRSYPWKAGETLAMSEAAQGFRSYLAVAGGIDVPSVMGSRSTLTRSRIGGLEGRPLRRGDLLPVGDSNGTWGIQLHPDCMPCYGSPWRIRALRGPQDAAFTSETIRCFFSQEWTISHAADRMAYRLEGTPLEHLYGPDLISDGLLPGSVQVPGNGLPIVLMADAHTTGGYVKIATVISADLPLLAQARPGDRILFLEESIEGSHKALWEMEKRIEEIGQRPFAGREYLVTLNDITYRLWVEEC